MDIEQSMTVLGHAFRALAGDKRTTQADAFRLALVVAHGWTEDADTNAQNDPLGYAQTMMAIRWADTYLGPRYVLITGEN
jgi:hypothetical protein